MNCPYYVGDMKLKDSMILVFKYIRSSSLVPRRFAQLVNITQTDKIPLVVGGSLNLKFSNPVGPRFPVFTREFRQDFNKLR